MQNKNYILPAEWHRQSCVQLTWPHEDTDWLPYLDDITETFGHLLPLARLVQQRLLLPLCECRCLLLWG